MVLFRTIFTVVKLYKVQGVNNRVKLNIFVRLGPVCCECYILHKLVTSTLRD